MANKSFSRKDRVNEQIRRELAELIRTELKDPRVGMVSLTDVEVTPDYAHAKVFFTTLAASEQLAEIKKGLDKASGFLRRELGRRVRIHTTPQLHFVYDNSIEHGTSLSRLIDEAAATSRQTSPDEDGEAPPDTAAES
ncbi:30S ribosome-binding factor RbfA [Azospira sp. APE16]|jgi:ribosome-binding factor A|uniref:Ribosome-binding factor A n=1 Tax=Azospira oryzae (strain ATCC BAA-33 / DSM 13638 / PS) TaxID=640081 RepID=G8QPG7_AZOOP|nr:MULTISPECIES: 30S ribosome-binding factor RbfA [Azospira]AEV27068.1 ribosome-binding factor A [Azospira oryzae PS]MDK9691528.1 30S ribosome-binding factor RbfA [Azospira sp.]